MNANNFSVQNAYQSNNDNQKIHSTVYIWYDCKVNNGAMMWIGKNGDWEAKWDEKRIEN